MVHYFFVFADLVMIANVEQSATYRRSSHYYVHKIYIMFSLMYTGMSYLHQVHSICMAHHNFLVYLMPFLVQLTTLAQVAIQKDGMWSGGR